MVSSTSQKDPFGQGWNIFQAKNAKFVLDRPFAMVFTFTQNPARRTCRLSLAPALLNIMRCFGRRVGIVSA
ncbi:hypothetical protein SBV1_1860008 [Verrucomicrobia bacterium]|nr:hypothetical protein SBV1_1860008 [Verrucomicrobiota bacterium]